MTFPRSSMQTLFKYLLFGVPLYIFIGAPLLKIVAPSFYGSSDLANYQSFENTDALVFPDNNLVCAPHSYNVRVLSREPLVVYIDGFLSRNEAQHLVNAAEENYKPSTIFTGEEESFDATIRNSSKAQLPRDNAVQCIEARARDFQGWRPDVYIEKLWAQRYVAGGHYTYHYDWSGEVGPRRGGRLSTFMVYLDDNCTGGGTNFPRLQRPPEQKWCDVLDCSSTTPADEQGITFKPVKGNAVYWENFTPDGRGYEETWHAGLPVRSGVKVGLNIWSWYQPYLKIPTAKA
ncbi:hypothetical protein EJ08DRAFT_735963 [Tothia fuscella]|uniref:Prolyl 4-hydroxylase alpha subunit domain-containing protein n=1 Tax=Tothia fuscella TaxID=1048955 RepID=A0A9P4TWK9_9PEZI|nr:hypothetical protein EJ08DRAFT_735963 [Tothia fuscella]